MHSIDRKTLIQRAVLAGAATVTAGLAGAASARAQASVAIIAAQSVVTAPGADDHNRIIPSFQSVLPFSIAAPPGHQTNLTEWGDGGEYFTAVDPAGAVLRRPPGDIAEHAPFSWETSLGSGPVRPNPVSYLGYNAGRWGGRIRPGEPTATYVIEADYDDGEKRTVEVYAEVASASGEAIVRPFFWQFRRDASSARTFVTRASIVGDPLSIQTPEGDDLAAFARNRTTIHAPEPSWDNGLTIAAPVGRAAFLRLGADATDNVLEFGTSASTPNLAHVQLNDRPLAWFFATPRGVPGAAFSVGEQDNSAAGVFAVANSSIDVMAIVARGRSSQRADLQQWQDSGGDRLLAVDREGRLRWSERNELPGTTAVDTQPAKYLRIIDSQGRALLVPAYSDPTTSL